DPSLLPSSRLPAARELERGDSGSPRSEDQVGAEVLLRVPERAVVRWVEAQVAVVTPASLDLRLGTGAGPGDLFGLRHLAERIARHPSGVPHRREVVRPGRAETDRDVAGMVHRYAPHPAPQR